MTILISFALVISVLLVLVVLFQNAKGGGLSSQFGGSSASNVLGVKKTGDVLERATWGFAIALMVVSLSTNLVGPAPSEDEILNKAKNERVGGQQNALPQLQNATPSTDAPKDSVNK